MSRGEAPSTDGILWFGQGLPGMLGDSFLVSFFIDLCKKCLGMSQVLGGWGGLCISFGINIYLGFSEGLGFLGPHPL